ncbi:hypothetical protein GCM10027275_42570 [Rhabdobacter roseus]|uniref:Lipoprotein n=1 Tax=Rhabdobacter roseus TaxID=1655419 RepID=A0A840TPJ3_9BACT|nr:hypothetical protein [Rhabdobacter roseus]MBB5286236.1 hypothetical protein [Rhabdobacter roseus]
MRKIVWVLGLLGTLLGCQNQKDLGPDCVRAKYLGPSDSPCGGPHKILILGGKERIYDLFPNLREADNLEITTQVPEALRQPGQELYFTPAAVEPRICLAIYIWYPEITLTHVSGTACR